MPLKPLRARRAGRRQRAGATAWWWEVNPASHPVFEACDEDKKGYLSREDFKVAVVMLFGYKPSKANALVWHQRPNASTRNWITKKAAQLHHSEIRQIFTAFDMQYRGFLTLEDFKRAFNSIAPKLPERIIVEAFREVDQDSDGHVSFKEFESAMNYGQNEVSQLHFA
uniref:EF-hand calcium binding domain 11 n=1 Tax=Chelonoidis abingdonii TaxID=106734 RepID=A0A8C0GBX5_CHEAB